MTATRRYVELGAVYMTPGIRDGVEAVEVMNALCRHHGGDWGDACEADRLANEEALECGSRLLSVYRDRNGTRFWVITEADRSATTVLLPEEY